MAYPDVNFQSSPNYQISRQQFDALLSSHKAFHEVAIRVTHILQDPSRTAEYRPVPLEEDCDPNQCSLFGNEANDPERTATLFPSIQGRSVHDDLQNARSRESEAVPIFTSRKPTFEQENARARRAYERKRQQSMKLFATVSTSYLAAQYDFQCR